MNFNFIIFTIKLLLLVVFGVQLCPTTESNDNFKTLTKEVEKNDHAREELKKNGGVVSCKQRKIIWTDLKNEEK